MPDHRCTRARPTTIWERRLIRAARRGDAASQARLLSIYEPMVRRIARTLYLPGGDRDDLAQEARVGVIDAARTWDPARGVPFSNFAWLCATREARMAVSAARARKHQVLNTACSLERSVSSDADDGDGAPHEECLRSAVGDLVARRDDDPVAKTLAREELRGPRLPRPQALAARAPRARPRRRRPLAPPDRRRPARPRPRRQQRAATRPPQARGAGRRLSERRRAWRQADDELSGICVMRPAC
jgi:RNA polymerase sigma factor (sigma-70 family)